MALENLAIRVSASATDAVTGLRSAKSATEGVSDEARSTNFVLERLGGTLDDAGNEALLAGVKAGGASAGFSSLSLSAGAATPSIGTFSSTVTASLIPALAAASTLIAPLTAGLTALASFGGGTLLGLGTVVGTGAVAGLTRLRSAECLYIGPRRYICA